MKYEQLDKVIKTISPSKNVSDINLDYDGTVSFRDMYDYYGKILGTGGFGVVLLGIDKTTHEEVAIKIINIHNYLQYCSKTSDSVSFQAERNLSLLQNEVTISQRLSHPSIIGVRKIFRTQHHVLIVMERAKCSLADYIKSKGGKLSEYECRVIITQVLEGLKYLHIINVVHKDMKPGNILLMSHVKLEGSIRITDFSISTKLSSSSGFDLASTAGTFLYKAPEQFKGEICTTVIYEIN